MRIENRSGHPNWRRLKIAWLFDDISSGTTPSSTNEEYYKDGEIPWVNTGDLTDGKLSSVNKKITRKAIADYPALKVHPKNSLIVALYGATIGKLAITQFDVTTNQACCVLNQPRNINIDFVFYWFLANREGIIQRSVGGGQKNISQGIIRSLRIDVPSLTVQNKIINFLDQKTSEIDTLIEDKEKLIALLEEKRQAIITEAVTKGLDPDVKMKDSGVEWIGEIPKHWELVRNKHLFKREKNIVGDQSSSYNVLSLTMRGVIHRDIESNEGKMPASFDSYQVVEPNNLLMCLFDIDVTPRTVGLVNSFGIVSPAYSNFKVIKENVDVSFYYYWYLMLDFDKKLLHLSKNLRNSIGTADFGALECPLPGFLEQQEIVKYLNEKETLIIESIAMIKEQIKVIKEYRQALIYEAVTGKIDVQVMLKETEQEEVSSL